MKDYRPIPATLSLLCAFCSVNSFLAILLTPSEWLNFLLVGVVSGVLSLIFLETATVRY